MRNVNRGNLRKSGSRFHLGGDSREARASGVAAPAPPHRFSSPLGAFGARQIAAVDRVPAMLGIEHDAEKRDAERRSDLPAHAVDAQATPAFPASTVPTATVKQRRIRAAQSDAEQYELRAAAPSNSPAWHSSISVTRYAPAVALAMPPAMSTVGPVFEINVPQ